MLSKFNLEKLFLLINLFAWRGYISHRIDINVRTNIFD